MNDNGNYWNKCISPTKCKWHGNTTLWSCLRPFESWDKWLRWEIGFGMCRDYKLDTGTSTRVPLYCVPVVLVSLFECTKAAEQSMADSKHVWIFSTFGRRRYIEATSQNKPRRINFGRIFGHHHQEKRLIDNWDKGKGIKLLFLVAGILKHLPCLGYQNIWFYPKIRDNCTLTSTVSTILRTSVRHV